MYNGPNIVTDGLVMCFDVNNTLSYVSGSTVLRDISNQTIGRSGSLVGGSFSNGAINMTGGQHISVTPFNRTANFTISTWFKINQISSGNSIQYIYTQQQNPPSTVVYTYLQSQWILVYNNYVIGHWYNSVSTLLNDGARVPQNTAYQEQSASIVFPNIWYNATISADSSGGALYINGVRTASSPTASQSTSVNQSYIGRRNDAQGQDYITGSVAVVMEYNRRLSDIEVLQNYNALKGRFNLD